MMTSVCIATDGSPSFGHQLNHWVCDIIVDAISLNLNLFTRSTLETITGCLPFYLLTRRIDEDIHSNFYEYGTHKNIYQFPKKCHSIAQKAVAIPMVGLSSLAVFAHDQDLRLTGRMIAIGLPFVHSGKNIIKTWRSKGCLRPWNGKFSCVERASGGFPSGHMANVVFMTALMGIRHGPRWAVPLSIFSAFVMADFVNGNRHYVSQLVAGIGLGVIYAFAASKVVDGKLNQLSENLTFGLEPGSCGLPTAKIVYRF